MSDRSQNYWSIGEVLSLLQDEFPEVTISKIRFLESQGLIDPERTPSGYRRFYQIDFDRLQWILTQQRDHYLPLKVIRDRLEAGEWHSTAEGRPDPDDGTRQMTLLAPVIDIHNGEPSSPDDEDVRTEQSAGDENGTVPTDPAELVEAEASDRAEDADVDRVSAGQADPDDPSESPDGATVDIAGDTAEHAATNDSTEIADGASASAAGAQLTTSGPSDETAESVSSPASQAMAEVDPGIALTLDEIAEASGCDVAMIRELERFGLVKGRTVGPTVLYDGEALTIARHASQFRTFGLDPRHLRTFRVGAEREVALLSQVVEPLRHRRDPETRRKSVETMEDLTDLAASLRAILMRQITREQLPPT